MTRRNVLVLISCPNYTCQVSPRFFSGPLFRPPSSVLSSQFSIHLASTCGTPRSLYQSRREQDVSWHLKLQWEWKRREQEREGGGGAALIHSPTTRTADYFVKDLPGGAEWIVSAISSSRIKFKCAAPRRQGNFHGFPCLLEWIPPSRLLT